MIFAKPGLSEFHESNSLIFGEVAKDSLAQSAMRWAKASGSRAPFPVWRFLAEVLGKQCSRSDCEQSKLARKKNFSELEKLIFCKASVFFKLLRKTMFQVPGLPTYGFWVEWKQSKHARNTNFFGA